MTYCIRCGSTMQGARCASCGWLMEDAGSGALAPAGAPPLAGAAPRTAAHLLQVSCTSSTFFRTVPPLIDIALHHHGGCTYALSEAIGGGASSLGRWGDSGFESSAMLAVEAPTGLELLADGSPVVIGAKGVVVNVTFATEGIEASLPSTRGHRTGRDVSCFAVDHTRTELALGIPSEASVLRLRMSDFGEGILADGLPGNPTALAFSADGELLGVGCYSGELCVVSGSGAQRQTLQRPASNEGVVALAATPDGAWVAAYEDGRVLFWDAGGTPVAQDALETEVAALAADPVTRQIVAGTGDGRLILWEPALEARIANEEIHDDRVARIVPVLGRGMIVTAGRGGDVVVTQVA